MSRLAWLIAVCPAAAFACNAQSPPPDLREAARLDREGKCSESEAIYLRALSAGAPSPAVLNNAANHYLGCGDEAKARRLFERVVKSKPSHLNANLQLARLAVAAGEKEQAATFLRVLSTSSDAGLWAEAGRLYARLGEYKQAQPMFQRIVAIRPGDFDALWNLGRAAARAGDLARARETFEAALQLRAGDAGVLLELGTAHAAGGDFPRAVFLLAQAQSKSPEDPGIALALARAADAAGYYGDAVIAFDRYLQLRPGDEAARRDRARAVANTPGRQKEGLAAMRAYVVQNPRDPVGHFQLAQLCWSTDAAESLDLLERALRLDPRLTPAHTARAWLLHRHGRDAEALEHLETAVQATPLDVRVLDLYGQVLMALERAAEAEKVFRQAAALAPTDWEVRLHLGRALMEQGREQEAKSWLAQYQNLRPPRQRDPRREGGMIELANLPEAQRVAREIERFQSMASARPDDPLLRLHLGSLLLADGRPEAAEAELGKLLAMPADMKTFAQAGRLLLNAGRSRQAVPFLVRGGAPLDRALAAFLSAGPEEGLAVLAAVPPAEQSGEYLLLKARMLDSAGRIREAQESLTGALAGSITQPQIAEQAALLLARYERYGDATRVLAQAIAAEPGHRGLLLLDAVVLALAGQSAESSRRLQLLETRWPEWDRPYRVHALVLSAAKRLEQAARKQRTAAALGSGAANARCQTLQDWLQPACRDESR